MLAQKLGDIFFDSLKVVKSVKNARLEKIESNFEEKKSA